MSLNDYDDDDPDDDFDDEDNFDCGMDRQGQCSMAGSEQCDWECPVMARIVRREIVEREKARKEKHEAGKHDQAIP